MKLRTIKNCISAASAVLTASLLLVSCFCFSEAKVGNIGASVILEGATLSETADAGAEYLSRMVFFGESTTAHLARIGGVLDTPAGRRQVWRDGSGTRMLERRIFTSPIDDVEKNTSRTLSEMLEAYPPDILVLSFGLNGAVGFYRDVDAFLANYRYLIEEIHRITPTTRIILQSIYPVRNVDAFSVDGATLNRYLMVLNEAIASLTTDFSYVRYADTASVLRDSDGALASPYDSGDGIHLTNAAYEKILFYLRTHAW